MRQVGSVVRCNVMNMLKSYISQMSRGSIRFMRIVLLCLALTSVIYSSVAVIAPSTALADPGQPDSGGGGGGGYVLGDPSATTCSQDTIFRESDGERVFDRIREVIVNIDNTLNESMEALYTGIIGNEGFRGAVSAAATLFVLFYAVSFLLGIMPATFPQAFMRLFKLAIVFVIISTTAGWTAYNEIVVSFFRDAVQHLINVMVSIAQGYTPVIGADGNPTGTIVGPDGSTATLGSQPDFPLTIFQAVIANVFSARMFVIVLATFGTGPYGPLMFLAILWAVIQLLMLIVKALQVYVLSMIVRAILLGMGPIFITFLFFERTKQLFMGWINQLVNFSLQPILLFGFLGFFSILITSAVEDLAPPGDVEVCYVKVENMGETPIQLQSWRFMINGEPFTGEWTSNGPLIASDVMSINEQEAMGPPSPTTLSDGAGGGVFPISPMQVLVFLIVTYIATQMASIVTQMAANIANSVLRLDTMPNALNEWFGGGVARRGMDWERVRATTSAARR